MTLIVGLWLMRVCGPSCGQEGSTRLWRRGNGTALSRLGADWLLVEEKDTEAVCRELNASEATFTGDATSSPD